MAKNKERYYIGRGKDDSTNYAYVYKGTKPPTIKKYNEKEVICSNYHCNFISSINIGIISVKDGEIKQLIMYTKDIKQ